MNIVLGAVVVLIGSVMVVLMSVLLFVPGVFERFITDTRRDAQETIDGLSLYLFVGLIVLIAGLYIWGHP